MVLLRCRGTGRGGRMRLTGRLPTIVEAALALYRHHSVEAIARHDAGAENLRNTSRRIEDLIDSAKRKHKKLLCFVTGVPGAGKTLVGLNVATLHRNNGGRDPA